MKNFNYQRGISPSGIVSNTSAVITFDRVLAINEDLITKCNGSDFRQEFLPFERQMWYEGYGIESSVARFAVNN